MCDWSDKYILMARTDSVEKWCVSILSGLWLVMCMFFFVRLAVSFKCEFEQIAGLKQHQVYTFHLIQILFSGLLLLYGRLQTCLLI